MYSYRNPRIIIMVLFPPKNTYSGENELTKLEQCNCLKLNVILHDFGYLRQPIVAVSASLST
jgi:hypothetical protein